MNKRIFTPLHPGQQGFVSILVCITIMIILSLITIGFARVMQREARQALDRQLSTQAFYAAESGVNDAISIAKQFPDERKDECATPQPGAYASLSPVLDPDGVVAYTCLLVNPTPGTLVWDEIGLDRSTVTRVEPEGGTNINRIAIGWQSADAASTGNFRPGGSAEFPNATSWGGTTGILRVSIFPFRTDGPNDRAALVDAAETYFLYPQTGGGGAITYRGSGANGSIVSGNCIADQTPRECRVDINVATKPGPGTYMYYVRLKSIYNQVTAELSAYSGADRVNLVGAQTLIDATGKTSDVFRRIQVRVPTQKYFDLPEYAIETADDLCKRITVAPDFMADECDPAGPDPGGVVTIGPVPPLPAPPPPPPSTTCNWGTVRSVAGNSNMGLMTAPTPAGDPAGAAAIRGNWWTSPNAAVYLSDLNGCSGGSTIDVSIGTTGTWGDPDVVEITLRRKSTRQPIGIRWHKVPNQNGGFTTYSWGVAGIPLNDLEVVLLADSASSSLTKQNEVVNMRPATFR